VKTSIFSKYKRAEACIRSSEFYDGNKKRRFIPLGIKINNIAYILVGAFRDGTLLQEV
jgi:hypothetical protein